MKRFAALFFFAPMCVLNAQETTTPMPQEFSVERSIFGIQTGLVGIWGYNEYRLANQISLRTEVGIDLITIKRTSSIGDEKINYLAAPNLSFEPRWYYNLKKRAADGKSIAGNSGNIFSLRTLYFPDAFLIGNNDGVNLPHQLAVIPKWGIRRIYYENISFETGIGVGPVFTVGDNDENFKERNVYFDLSLRIGYHF